MREIDAHIRDQFYRIVPPLQAQLALWHPWIKGYNGEFELGMSNQGGVFARIWLDQDLKKEMGF